MGYSFYEIYITALRAFSGMGFPHGADEDAAYIISWLELNNLHGINKLTNSIALLDNQYNGISNIKETDEKIDLNHKSILMKGPSIIDYFESLLLNQDKVVFTLNNCPDPFLLLPLLYKASSRILFSQLIYYSENKIHIHQVMKNKTLIGKKNKKKYLKENQAEIILSNKKNISLIKNVEKQITDQSIQKKLALALKPNRKDWNKVSEIANRTFVPESEESRNRGAGGGDDND